MSDADEREVAPPSVRDHLANERTLLAWVRTALTVIGLGFLIDRLAVETGSAGLASLVGIGMVVLGGVVAVAGGYSYNAARREMESGTYRPQAGLHLAIVFAVVLGAVVTAAYLVASP
jgi:putative membrane protein